MFLLIAEALSFPGLVWKVLHLRRLSHLHHLKPWRRELHRFLAFEIVQYLIRVDPKWLKFRTQKSGKAFLLNSTISKWSWRSLIFGATSPYQLFLALDSCCCCCCSRSLCCSSGRSAPVWETCGASFGIRLEVEAMDGFAWPLATRVIQSFPASERQMRIPNMFHVCFVCMICTAIFKPKYMLKQLLFCARLIFRQEILQYHPASWRQKASKAKGSKNSILKKHLRIEICKDHLIFVFECIFFAVYRFHFKRCSHKTANDCVPKTPAKFPILSNS